MFTDRDHHQSWVAGAAIACTWLFCGVSVLAVVALGSYAIVFGPKAITGVFQ